MVEHTDKTLSSSSTLIMSIDDCMLGAYNILLNPCSQWISFLFVLPGTYIPVQQSNHLDYNPAGLWGLLCIMIIVSLYHVHCLF